MLNFAHLGVPSGPLFSSAKPFDNSHKPKISDEFQTSSCRPQSQKKRTIVANLKAKDQDQVQPLDTNPKYERIKIKVKPKA